MLSAALLYFRQDQRDNAHHCPGRKFHRHGIAIAERTSSRCDGQLRTGESRCVQHLNCSHAERRNHGHGRHHGDLHRRQRRRRQHTNDHGAAHRRAAHDHPHALCADALRHQRTDRDDHRRHHPVGRILGSRDTRSGERSHGRHRIVCFLTDQWRDLGADAHGRRDRGGWHLQHDRARFCRRCSGQDGRRCPLRGCFGTGGIYDRGRSGGVRASGRAWLEYQWLCHHRARQWLHGTSQCDRAGTGFPGNHRRYSFEHCVERGFDQYPRLRYRWHRPGGVRWHGEGQRPRLCRSNHADQVESLPSVQRGHHVEVLPSRSSAALLCRT